MKKLTLILAFIGMITLNSCSEDDNNYVDTDTISEVFEYSNVNFLPNDYGVFLNFPYEIYSSDMVLIYRLSAVDQGLDVWKLMPENFYFQDGTLDFGFNNDFTTINANVYMIGNDLASVSADFRLNQVLRVVVIPGYLVNKSTQNKDFSNYNEVVKTYNIDDSNIKKIKL